MHFTKPIPMSLSTAVTELADGGVMLGDAQCTSDYLVIPGGSADGDLGSFSRDRFCGVTLGVCDGAAGAATCSPAAKDVVSE